MRTPEVLDIAIAHHLIEALLERCMSSQSNDKVETRVTGTEREAIRKSLDSSRMLLGIAYRLIVQPGAVTPKESAERLKQVLDEIRQAARTAYEAGLLLTGVD
ncbi:MAG: hypothetical protein KKC85_20810 [Gammaproteobacteria bacterium]|nr:hypothetical protein [Gammaproteobacteria bacterium]MBU1443110.1 hypothetical protein [Gammaproteobacteria bacterium]MBU2288852.1 hypothetical protein [Gammaproteobacteria bacterium]